MGIYSNEGSATFSARERARENHDATVFGLARLHELNRAAVGARIVAPLAIQQLEGGTVRVHAVQVHMVVRQVVIPAAEYDFAVRHHGGIEVVALVERHLFETRSIVVHYVQIERELVLVLVHRRKTALVFIEQQRL